MNFDTVGPGHSAPHEINVVVEIPQNGDPIKYEVDKESGAIFVDRFLGTPMRYPCNYGYIPCTSGGPLKRCSGWQKNPSDASVRL